MSETERVLNEYFHEYETEKENRETIRLELGRILNRWIINTHEKLTQKQNIFNYAKP